MHASPLDEVLRQAGATMVDRAGMTMAAHFGSPTSEAAVCRHTVGLADRSDRTTFTLRGADADSAVEVVTGRTVPARTALRSANAWWFRVEPDYVLVRCDPAHAPTCRQSLTEATAGLVAIAVADVTSRYAGIGVLGPRASSLLRDAGLGAGTPVALRKVDGVSAVVLREGKDSFEVLVAPADAPAMWKRLSRAGARHHYAYVGAAALDLLAAGHYVDAGSPVMH